MHTPLGRNLSPKGFLFGLALSKIDVHAEPQTVAFYLKSMIKNGMARMILGSRGSVIAVSQTRRVLAELSEEWPDVNLTQRTFQGGGGELLKALEDDKVHIVLFDLSDLPLDLPEGCRLVAVTKRHEPRSALLSKGNALKSLDDIADATLVGVQTERDGAFVRAAKLGLNTQLLTGNFDDHLAQLASEELSAIVLPCSYLLQLERRRHTDALLDPEVFPPAPGQGCIALVVKDSDDLAFELAYSLQHRPSFDRVRTERAFARAFAGREDLAVGALANVSPDGDINLFGAVTVKDKPLNIQAEISGEAAEGESLGKELAKDVLEQLEQRR